MSLVSYCAFAVMLGVSSSDLSHIRTARISDLLGNTVGQHVQLFQKAIKYC